MEMSGSGTSRQEKRTSEIIEALRDDELAILASYYENVNKQEIAQTYKDETDRREKAIKDSTQTN